MSQWKGYGPDNLPHTNIGLADTAPARDAGASRGELTYEPYYGLQSKPFSVSTDPRTLYKSPSHAAVLEGLLSAIRRREGLIVLTGEMGTGKTTLCRAALYQLDRKTFSTVVPDPFLSREDLLRMLLVGFGEVSVDDLKQGRLKGTPRADLGCQLYEFLTSLESVDAFAVLVIDEAQHLAPPLLDEIRALSELEAGRRLLQIVLVGQPELRSRLRLPEMQPISQRVTTACELQALTREGVGGYVSHRLAVAGGARDRVEFSQAALDLVYDASKGIPRLVNRICDRTLFHGHVDRAAHLGRSHVGTALHELELTAPGAMPSTPQAPPAAARVEPPSAGPGGLFAKKASADTASPVGADLNALLDLAPMARRTTDAGATASSTAPAFSRRPTPRRHWMRRALGSMWLPVLGMTVLLGTAGLAASIVAVRPLRVEMPEVAAAPPMFPAVALAPAVPPTSDVAALALSAPAPSTARPSPTMSATPVPPAQTWVVQVAAFSNPQRASALVARLASAGLPAYEAAPTPGTPGNLTLVRVGPFRSAEEADDVRAKVRTTPDYEGAFVRNITAH